MTLTFGIRSMLNFRYCFRISANVGCFASDSGSSFTVCRAADSSATTAGYVTGATSSTMDTGIDSSRLFVVIASSEVASVSTSAVSVTKSVSQHFVVSPTCPSLMSLGAYADDSGLFEEEDSLASHTSDRVGTDALLLWLLSSLSNSSGLSFLKQTMQYGKRSMHKSPPETNG